MTSPDTVTTEQLHPAYGELVRRFTTADLPDHRAPLPHEIRERLALSALLRVVQLHEPSFIGNWVLCSECASIAWPLPSDPKSMWSDVVYPCATVREIEEAYCLGLDWAAANETFLRAVQATRPAVELVRPTSDALRREVTKGE